MAEAIDGRCGPVVTSSALTKEATLLVNVMDRPA
jgi:hypothetical protein